MSIEVLELAGPRRRPSAYRTERLYKITGASSEVEAAAALADEVPSTLGNHIYNTLESSVEEFPGVLDVYIGSAVWTFPEFGTQSPGSFVISFDITGQQQRITQAREHLGDYYRTGVKEKEFRGAINVGSDGTVEGTEILIPYLTFQIDKTYTLASVVGKVNSSAYLDYEAGELLLYRCAGRQRANAGDATDPFDNDAPWDLSFAFAVSENETNLQAIPETASGAGDGVVVPEKLGWDYLWYHYDFEKESLGSGSGEYSRKLPISCHLERVYKFTDYSVLNITP
jgi:hypothetical protein